MAKEKFTDHIIFPITILIVVIGGSQYLLFKMIAPGLKNLFPEFGNYIAAGVVAAAFIMTGAMIVFSLSRMGKNIKPKTRGQRE